MREVVITEEQIVLENGMNCLLRYYITVSEIFSGATLVFENYGIRVVMKKKERDADYLDEALAMNVTSSVGKIIELVFLLSKNKVTPMSLMDVVIDYI